LRLEVLEASGSVGALGEKRGWRNRGGFAKIASAMKHVVPHDLGQERAKKVAESALATYADKFAKYSPSVRWVSDKRADIAFSIKGMSLSGSLEVQERAIELDLEVPFFLRPFKSQALGVIEAEIKDWIGKAKAEGG
jgi:hypothetical protein